MNRKCTYYLLLFFCFISASCSSNPSDDAMASSDAPRIINIINFIRQTDYRVENSDSLMFEAVQEQIKLVNKYDFPATFLFQYDALINPAYQELMKTQLSSQCEIGAWWEITQPHVEAAGIKWRGEHRWVSHANIAFTTGYTPKEREQLVDVYMVKFKEIYGKYPKSVGSWYIDSHTLAYMYEKYGIVASCNCKDQVGTDGYTLWGGYWNQAYYPSRVNAYMPAQTDEYKIPVPIFRMLGSDPIYQYDTGLGGRRQGVISLEPVYRESGMNKEWVKYFMEALADQPCLAFSYAQAGQENSFTWRGMQRGLEMQFPLFDSLRTANKIKIETLEASGMWFKEQFPHTPPTAVTAMTDIRNEGRKTVWYNSRYYRTNLLWEGKSFRFRDIHLFDEKFESAYYKTAGEGNQFFYYTLPLVDGFLWSTRNEYAGIRIIKTDKDGNGTEVQFNDPVVKETAKGVLHVDCKDDKDNTFSIIFYEGRIEVLCKPKEKDLSWALEMKSSPRAELPFKSFEKNKINANFRDYNYTITCKTGTVEQAGPSDGYVFRMIPAKNKLSIDFVN